MRITTGMLQRNVLADLNRATNRLTDTQGRLSSGKQITRPSDDPAGASQALLLREGLKGTQQHRRNVDDATSWADATETALSNMTDLVHEARNLAIQGSTDALDPASRKAIADQVAQLAEALKAEANTKFAGSQLFSGTATTTPPYAAGSDTYQGNAGAIAREIGPGVSVTVNTNVRGILGDGQASADGKLLAVLSDIHDHLLSGNGASLRGTDLDRLDQGSDALSDARAANGALTNRLESAGTRLDSLEELSTKTLSTVEDADMAKTLIDFSTQQSAYQAALKAGANIVQTSLMDFLR